MMTKFDVATAKERLDRLIRKARADLYKPIAIAEILYRHRVDNTVDLSKKEDYRRRSYNWMRSVIKVIHDKTTQLNSRYWDQTFDADVLPPEALVELGNENTTHNGVVECYVYWHLKDKFSALKKIRDELETQSVDSFSLESFLSQFKEDQRFRRSVDKAYEIVVYALFNAVTTEMGAAVTLSVDGKKHDVLADFEDFARLVLGIDVKNPEISQPARLFRVGTANAADAGLDMWANFGPAVQVKHVSLSPEQTSDICSSVQADSVVVVCKTGDADAIRTVLLQAGFGEKLRGLITEDDLIRWYATAFSEKYRDKIGRGLLDSIAVEMHLEFPLTDVDRIDNFFANRKYDEVVLSGTWAVS